LLQFIGPVRRVALADEFLRQNPAEVRDIFRERDVSLKRDVVVLKRTCHRLQFVHTFKNIPPGKYMVQVNAFRPVVGTKARGPFLTSPLALGVQFVP
jgi:hypothetical protein